MPFPSQACRTCRSRHLKCDETRPVCGQCSSSGRECLGYQGESSGLLFRDENTYASSVTRRPRGGARNDIPDAAPRPASTTVKRNKKSSSKKPTSRTASLPTQTTATSNTVTISRQNSASIPEPLNYSLEDEAFALFAHRFIDSRVGPTFTLTFLSDFNSSFGPTKPPSTLNLAVSALSLANLGGVDIDTVARSASTKKYMGALKQMRTDMADRSLVLSDELSLAVMILALYENRMGNMNKEKLFRGGYLHLDGGLALLKARKEYGGADDHSRTLDRHIRRQMIRTRLYRASALPSWLQDGAEFGETGVDLELDRCLVQVLDLRQQADKVLRKMKASAPEERHSCRPELDNLIRYAYETDRKLGIWSVQLPKSWTYSTLQIPTKLSRCSKPEIRSLFWDEMMHEYTDFDQGVSWNQYRAARIVTNSIIRVALMYATASAPSMVELSNQACDFVSSNIEALVNDVCASISYSFGVTKDTNMDTFNIATSVSMSMVNGLMWPLVISSAMRHIPDAQRRWLKEKVRMMSLISGNKSLNGLADLELHHNLQLGVDKETK